MALLPTTPPAWVALAIIVAGLGAAVLRRYPMAYTMALLSMGVYVVQLLSQQFLVCNFQGLLVRCDPVLEELAFVAPEVAAGQGVLTPFTYMFLHADLLHLAGNMFMLLTAGPALEERIGTRNFLSLYVVAGLGAAGASAALWALGFFSPLQALAPNVGASGAIFGVLTGFAMLFPREKLPMILPMMFFVFWMPAFTVLLLYLALNVVYIFSATNIAWWGHFAGFFVGVAAAPVLHRRLPRRARVRVLEVDTEALGPLAASNVQRSALRELERLRHAQTPDDRALAEVWWERFVGKAHCPRCHQKLRLRDGTLACPRGDFEVKALRDA